MLCLRAFLITSLLTLCFVAGAPAQQTPEIGYMFPPGAAAGESVEVTLGGFDWTPDIQFVIHDPRIKLELTGKLGPVIVPEPPYWFGAKARRPPFLLPREVQARLTIPADIEPGVVRWQVANANGASQIGKFLVFPPASHSATDRDAPNDSPDVQVLPALPVLVSGQVKKIEEVDRFRFTADKDGLVTCALVARALGSDLNAVVEVRDTRGQMVADTADTDGTDTAVTFAVQADQDYDVSVYDVDFRGNRALFYQLQIIPGPRVVAAIPVAGRRGETQSVELVGYGLASGKPVLESITRDVQFPADPKIDSFRYQVDTPHGPAGSVRLLTSDQPQLVELPRNAPHTLTLPVQLTGVIDEPFGEDRFQISGKKGDLISLDVEALRIGSPLDVAISVLDATGQELKLSDDLPTSIDASLEFPLPADGDYTLVVSDASPHSGNRAAVYRLIAQAATPDFSVTLPEALSVPIGGTGKVSLRAAFAGRFKAPIKFHFEGLPAGVTAPAELEMPAGRPVLNFELTCTADAAATLSQASLVAEAQLDDQTIRHTFGPVVVAATIQPPFVIDAEGQDDVLKWPRGTTFPGIVLIQRNAAFTGEITLEMTSKQGRHRQGISGPELLVPADVSRIVYPVRLPEWLETTRTSRMVVNGVAQVADPQGNVRYSVLRQKTRMGFLPTGALLKLSAVETEISAAPGTTLQVPLSISRSGKLTESLQLELLSGDTPAAAAFTAQPQTLSSDQTSATFPITFSREADITGEHELVIRATAIQEGNLPVISEARVLVLIAPK